MGATVIVVDTNQLRSSPLLRSHDWSELTSKAADWGLRFAVPEVCLLEAVSVVRRDWLDRRAGVEKLRVGEFGLAESQQEWLDTIDTKIAEYDVALRARLADIGAEIIPIPESVRLLDVVQRAIDRRKPYPEGDGKKGSFRDTLIWHITQSIAADDNGCEVWLISANHNDFGNKSNADDEEACPYPLHPHLIEDLESEGLSDRVSYVRTLGRLVQHLAGTYDALPPTEQEALFELLDKDEFERRLSDSVKQIELNPAAAALPLRTLDASIRSSSSRSDSLQLVDAAMRGAGAWTAQFHQTIEVAVDLTDLAGDTTVLDKSLNMSGRLEAGSDGRVHQLIVTSIEALPGDAMRRAWAKRRDVGQFSEPLVNPDLVREYIKHIGPINPSMPTLNDLIRDQIKNTPSGIERLQEQLRHISSLTEQFKNTPSGIERLQEQLRHISSLTRQFTNTPNVTEMFREPLRNPPSLGGKSLKRKSDRPSPDEAAAEEPDQAASGGDGDADSETNES